MTVCKDNFCTQVRQTASPHFSPVRLSSSDSCLLSIRYDNLLTISTYHTALDAFIAPFPLLTTCRACPCESRGAGSGRNPAGSLRRANRLSCRFVSLVFLPPAGTCSLRPSPCLQPAEPAPAKAGGQALGATLRAAVAVQIVCPDNLSLNQNYCYAFGPRIKYGAGSGTRWRHKSARSRFGRPQDALCAMDGAHQKS